MASVGYPATQLAVGLSVPKDVCTSIIELDIHGDLVLCHALWIILVSGDIYTR
jgi:hypothetical protein